MTSSEGRIPEIYLLGSGGHAKVVRDCLIVCGNDVAGYLQPDKSSEDPFATLAYIGGDDKLAELDPESSRLVNGIGSIPGNSDLRRSVFKFGLEQGHTFHNIIHPSAIISDVVFAQGLQIMAGAVLQPGTRVGQNVIINTRASVDHDCVVGDHVHIAPGAVLSGNVRIGADTHIGTGAIVIQGVDIGSNCVVGAGAVVTQDVPNGAIVYPARSSIKEGNDS